MNKLIKNLLITFLVIGFIGLISVLVFDSFITSDESYKTAIEFVKTNPEINKITGGLSYVGYIGFGSSITYYKDGGEGNYNLPIIGKKNNVTLKIYVKLDSLGKWNVEKYDILQ